MKVRNWFDIGLDVHILDIQTLDGVTVCYLRSGKKDLYVSGFGFYICSDAHTLLSNREQFNTFSVAE